MREQSYVFIIEAFISCQPLLIHRLSAKQCLVTELPCFGESLYPTFDKRGVGIAIELIARKERNEILHVAEAIKLIVY